MCGRKICVVSKENKKTNDGTIPNGRRACRTAPQPVDRLHHVRIASDLPREVGHCPVQDAEQPFHASRLRTKKNQLRGIVALLGLLACCRGFDPDENPSFWRDYFAIPARRSFAWASTEKVSPSHQITREAFGRFRVICAFEGQSDYLAAAIEACFSTREYSRAMTIRMELEQSLEDFLERQPPTMMMELCAELKFADAREGHSANCRTLLRTALQIERTWWDGSSSANHEKIPLIVDTSEYPLPTAGVDHLTDTITQSCFEWKALTLNARGVDVASLRQLMRELVRVDTLQTLAMDLTECGRGCVAAVVSALPSLRSLRSFQLRNPVGSISGLIDPSRTQFFHWLAYALLARKNQGLWLALDIDVRRGIYREIEASCRSTNCLQRFGLHAEGVACATNGTSAILSDGSILDAYDEDTPHASIQVGISQRVDVIAQTEADAIVVVPGVGLMTTPMSSLREWRRSRTTQAQVGGDQFGFLVDSFAADVGSAEEAVESMKVFGSRLSSLTIVLDGYTLAKETLERIMERCPRLKSLKVTSGYVTSFEPLLDAYQREECQVESLVFKPRLLLASRPAIRVGGRCVQEVIEALATPGHPIARVLKTFDFQFVSLTNEWLQLLSHALWTNRSVEILRLREDAQTSVARDRLDALVDQPLRQNERSKNAIYEFLLAARRLHVVRELPTPCIKLIATYAAIPVLRCVSWTLFE